MNYYGLFEGISGFGLAFKRAGATIKAVCETDKACQSVLRRHHPEAEIISDVKTIGKDTFAGQTIDVLAGGFPCQDLSVAGQRKGLDGERSGLWFEFIRIIGDHKPRWVVIENVPGLLSSNSGRDFAVILRGLAECGYFSAYRVFDSQYDGVAQRRNRVFIVASLGNAGCVEVLFERESGQWDSPPRREAGEDIAGNAIAGTVSSKWAKGTGGPSGNECQNLTVTPTLRSNGDAHSGSTTGDGLVVKDRIGGWIEREDRIFAYQSDSRRSTAQEHVYHKKNGLADGLTAQKQNVVGQFGVRRLTPTECEALQGFPRDWTAFGHDGKPISDSARYRMLGNAVCVPTAEWIARRITQREAA